MSDSTANDARVTDAAAAEPDADPVAADASAATPGDPAAEGAPTDPLSVEDLVAGLETVTAERDDYLDRLLRLQAEFENYRKAVAKRESDAVERANDKLIGELLPVLDAFDGAVANGNDDVAPLRTTVVDALSKQGLERLDPIDAPFDPEEHEAVMHEESADVSAPTVAEVLRVGYRWNGRVLRPVMVKTVG